MCAFFTIFIILINFLRKDFTYKRKWKLEVTKIGFLEDSNDGSLWVYGFVLFCGWLNYKLCAWFAFGSLATSYFSFRLLLDLVKCWI
jgi:hypothetical protein